MTSLPSEELRGVIRQHLETDRLLGVEVLPIPIEKLRQVLPAPTRPSRTDRPSDPQPSPVPVGPPAPHTHPPDPERAEQLKILDEQQVKGCTNCKLSETRTNTVFGQGSPDARLVFVGEAPGYDEDQQGLAFVGRAGQLLTRMIAAMGLTRDEVFICNVLKCRPPDNRTPATDEIAACSPYLFGQLTTLDPEVIVALGAPAAQTLLNTTQGIGRLRGRFHDFHPSGSAMIGESVPLMPTYHPAYLLRSPGEKSKAWDDLKKVMTRLGLPIPEPHR